MQPSQAVNNRHQLSRLLPLFFIIFIDSLAYFLVIPVLLRLFVSADTGILPIHTRISIRNDLYSLAVALSTLAFMIAAPFVGHFSDKYGRKKTLFFCLLAALIGFILPVIGIIKRNVSLILLGRFIAGASTSSQPVAQAAISDFATGKRKAFYLSMIAFAMTLAMVLGPIAGSYLSDPTLVHWFSGSTPYLLGVLLSFINIILLLIFFSDPMQSKAHTWHVSWKQRLVRLKNLLVNQHIYLLLLTFLCLELAWSQYYQSIFLVLAQHFRFSADKIGLFTGYIGFWMSLGLTVFYRLFIRYFSITKILWISLIAASIGLFICNYLTYPLVQWIGIIPTSIFIGMAYPSLLTLMSNRTSAEHQGWVLGTASTVLGFAWMITGFISGFLINIYIALPIMIATFFIILAIILLFIFSLIGKPTNVST